LVAPFDPRCAGLLFETDHDLDFDKLMKFRLSQQPNSMHFDKAGVVRLEWRLKISNVTDARERLWIDLKNGFVPLRFELQERDTRYTYREVWKAPDLLTTATWRQFDGAWLPVACMTESTDSGGGKLSYELQFEWQSVNRPVPGELFTAEDITPPNGLIIDCRVNPAVIVRRPR
jgi:hypothetical protein